MPCLARVVGRCEDAAVASDDRGTVLALQVAGAELNCELLLHFVWAPHPAWAPSPVRPDERHSGCALQDPDPMLVYTVNTPPRLRTHAPTGYPRTLAQACGGRHVNPLQVNNFDMWGCPVA